jgi:hypothetical protein
MRQLPDFGFLANHDSRHANQIKKPSHASQAIPLSDSSATLRRGGLAAITGCAAGVFAPRSAAARFAISAFQSEIRNLQSAFTFPAA